MAPIQAKVRAFEAFCQYHGRIEREEEAAVMVTWYVYVAYYGSTFAI